MWERLLLVFLELLLTLLSDHVFGVPALLLSQMRKNPQTSLTLFEPLSIDSSHLSNVDARSRMCLLHDEFEETQTG